MLRPIALLLQETRGPCKILDYNTFFRSYYSKPTLTPHDLTTGVAVALVHESCHAVEHHWDQARNGNRKVVIVLVTPPGGKPMLLVPVYYKPCSRDIPSTQYDWIPYLFSLRVTGPIVIERGGGDSSSNHQGQLLEQTLEFSPLQLRNEYGVPARIGLYYTQRDTTPDLTLATPGAVKSWHTLNSSWGSDHYPIVLQINSNKFRTTRAYRLINWTSYRSQFAISPQTTLD